MVLVANTTSYRPIAHFPRIKLFTQLIQFAAMTISRKQACFFFIFFTVSVPTNGYGKETNVISDHYYYFITIYNQQHIILSFYNILNIVNFKVNLYI